MPVYAAEAGTVFRSSNTSGTSGSMGNYVMINHETLGLTTVYMHASKVHVNAGYIVVRGQHIMDVGDSGSRERRICILKSGQHYIEAEWQ